RSIAAGADRLRPLSCAAARARCRRRGSSRRGSRRDVRRGAQAAQGDSLAALEKLLEPVAVRLAPSLSAATREQAALSCLLAQGLPRQDPRLRERLPRAHQPQPLHPLATAPAP